MTSKDEKLLKILKSNVVDYVVKYGDDHEAYKTATVTIQVKTLKEFTEEMAGKEIHYTPCKSISNDDFEIFINTLCRKQEEYIEENLKSPSDTEKCCEPAKPDYDELCGQIDDLNYKLSVLIDENNALRWSLTTAHKEMNDWKNRSDMWQENYYKEHRRAEKLFEELDQLTKEELENEK